MNLSLLDLQQAFVLRVARLIEKIYASGYKATFGEAYRTPEQAAWNAAHGKGISNSLHMDRLAVDFQLFKDGVYLTDGDSYKQFGEYWKTLSQPGIDCAWGGDFQTLKDYNHFSIGYGGRK